MAARPTGRPVRPKKPSFDLVAIGVPIPSPLATDHAVVWFGTIMARYWLGAMDHYYAMLSFVCGCGPCALTKPAAPAGRRRNRRWSIVALVQDDHTNRFRTARPLDRGGPFTMALACAFHAVDGAVGSSSIVCWRARNVVDMPSFVTRRALTRMKRESNTKNPKQRSSGRFPHRKSKLIFRFRVHTLRTAAAINARVARSGTIPPIALALGR
jgi:hypothetical protein